MSLRITPVTAKPIAKPIERVAGDLTAAVVSLPFFTPFATCYPGVLLADRLRALGGAAYFVPAHMEFYAFSRSRGLSERLYKSLSDRHFVADVALLPLWSGEPEDKYAAERAELARTEFLPTPDEATRLRAAFDAYLDRLADRILETDAVCLPAVAG